MKNGAEKTEHTTENLLVWLEKQPPTTLDDFVKRAQALSNSQKNITCARLKSEMEDWCRRDGVTLKDVYYFGQKKKGRPSKADKEAAANVDTSNS
jgi:hypothetical protein